MSAYVLDEVPLIEDPPIELTPVLLDIPSLEESLFDRSQSATIYGGDTEPMLSVSTYATAGRARYDHWRREIPTTVFVRFILLCLGHWPFVRRVGVDGWEGAAVLVSGYRDTEAHVFVYSHGMDVSLDLHIQLGVGRRETFERGLAYLREIRPHQG